MGATVFRVEDAAKWEHQNEAEYIDFVEGVLLDSYVLACKRGYCFVYARSANAGWSSWHEYKFAPYKDEQAVKELWDEWLDFEESAAEWMNGLEERSIA